MIKTLSVLCLLIMMSVGCSVKSPVVTNLPTNVTQVQVQNWDKAVKQLSLLATSTNKTTKAVAALVDQGMISAQSSKVLFTALRAIATAGQDGTDYLKTVPNDWGLPVQGKVATLTALIAKDLQEATTSGVLGITDSNARNSVLNLLNELNAGVQIINSLITMKTAQLEVLYVYSR